MHSGDRSTFPGVLRAWASASPDRRALSFLYHGEGPATLSYGELDRRARALAAGLQALGARGERVVLALPFGPEFPTSFLACLYAGAIAVPAAPPGRGESAARLAAIVADCSPSLLLTVAALGPRIAAGLPPLAAECGLRLLEIDRSPELALAAPESWREPELASGDTAFLQYTSGSTSTPRGVEVTHANLLANQRLIAEACGHDEGSVFLSWLPLFHDLGLIGNLLQALYTGATCHLMAPGAFLQRPRRWLEAVASTRATTSGGPNFAYELCLRRLSSTEREGLDLSSWQVAFSGAEPVRHETLERFASAFAPQGFRRAAFYPCYGLAEATLMVAGGAPRREPLTARFSTAALARNEASETEGGGRMLVGCGGILGGLQARIVDPVSAVECPPGRIGEIWVAGDSVARGYWNRPQETARCFAARLAGSGEGPFLRTGDLGCLHRGELFITGRLKDLIILRGRNLYPQDIELTVERSHPALRSGGAAAFAVEAGVEERLVVVAELERRHPGAPETLAEVAAAVRRAVAEEHEARVTELVLIRAGTLPRTTSGKVQRGACRTLHLDGGLDVVAATRIGEEDEETAGSWPGFDRGALLALPAEEREPALVAALAARVGRAVGSAPGQLDRGAPLTALGLDSLALLELRNDLETGLGAALPAAALLAAPSLADLARQALAFAAEAPAPAPPRSREEGAEFPLSAIQQSLWFLAARSAGSGTYNVALGVRLGPEVAATTLRAVFDRWTARHPSLRTTFVLRAGEPVQRVAAEGRVEASEVDAAGWDAARLAERLAAEAHRPFDLAAGPLLRATLFHRGAGERILLLAAHHLVVDGWSLWVLLDELAQLSTAAERGEASALAPLPCDYRDFVRSEAELLAGPIGEELWRFWRAELTGELAPLALPVSRAQPLADPPAGRAECIVERQLAARLRALARARETTLFTTLLAAFQALLYRYTGQDDFVIGAPAVGRSWPELAGIVGCFFNPLPLRADLSGEPVFLDLLARARRRVAAALAHQDYPAHRLAARLQAERGVRPALFDVTFIFQRPHRLAVSAAAGGRGLAVRGDLAMELFPVPRGGARSDLELEAIDSGDGLQLTFHYRADLFEPAIVERMADCLVVLLESVVAEPERAVAELRLLAPAAERQLLEEWSAGPRRYPQEGTVGALLATQTAAFAERIATQGNGRSLCYRELDRAADRLARCLGDALGPGLREDRLVGLVVDHDHGLPVGILGIWKAGCGFVPIDPGWPRERIALVAAECRLAALVTEARHLVKAAEAAAAPPGTPALPLHLICLDGVPADFVPAPGSVLHPLKETAPEAAFAAPAWADPDGLAYVIYTSGSTGRPKGVALTHRNLIPVLVWGVEALGLGGETRALQTLSYWFDFGVFEVVTTLLAGGTLCFQDRDGRGEPRRFAEQVRRDGIDTVHATPSFFREVAALGERLPGLAVLHLGGEELTPALVLALGEAVGPGCAVFNGYGPTEAAINAALFALGPGGDAPPGALPIGRPSAHNRLYLLDSRLRLLPAGALGQLYVGGEGVARGYLARPDLTAERFLPDPFAGTPGARLYRTGDLCRFRADGNLEFLGRVDDQVKVRGYRIELGEVQAALERHPAVLQGAVVARDDLPGGRGLVAYVVPAGSPIPAGELRAFLRRRLPEAMIPAAFVSLPALPRNANGKLDRRALPAPEPDGEPEEWSAPHGLVEEGVAGICAELLGRPRLGARENLLDLGCHSLLATRIVARLREVFKVELPLASFFATPTVAGLAAAVEAAGDRGGCLPPIPRVAGVFRHPVSFAQERIWFLHQLEPQSAAYNIPRALRIEGPLAVGAVARAFSEIFRRHEILRTTFPAESGAPVQVVHPPWPVRVPVVNLAALPGGRRDALLRDLIVEQGQRPFDLEAGPLLRLLLLETGAAEHVLFLVEHHLVHDGWTQGVLIGEFLELYRAFTAGEPSPLPEPPIQYGDFARWQRQHMAGEALVPLLDYWRAQLAGVPPALELPFDHPRPVGQGFRGALRRVDIESGLAERVRTLGRSAGATLFMSTLAALAVLLCRLCGQELFTIGTGIANRRRQEMEGLLGMIINTLVLRVDLGGAPTFAELLLRTREVCLGAYAHQDLPFEKLVEALRPERTLGRMPLFQVMYGFLDTPMRELALPGATLTLLDSHNRTAKFDLNLTVLPHADERLGPVAPDAGSRITFLWEYSTELFFATTVERMIGQYRQILDAAVRDPEVPISQLPLLSAAERHQLLTEAGASSLPYSDEAPLHRLFEAQAAAAPFRLAVVYGEEGLSYGELNARANRLARRLRALGVEREGAVAILAERSPALVVAMLAVLKAGGAYLPLDLNYPPERLASVLADAGPAVILTQQALAARLPEGRAAVLCLDTGWGTVAAEAADDLPSDGAESAERLAYLIYTSGSAGGPKGVAIPQRGVNRLVFGSGDLRLTAADRIAQAATPAFDAATYEIWGALLSGARLVGIPTDAALQPARLAQAIGQQGITVLFLTTALFQQLAREAPALFAPLRCLLAGGEMSDPRWFERVAAASSPARLLHVYGPTEATTFATWHPVAPGDIAAPSVPIGRSIANTPVYLCDPDLAAVPLGVRGELYIGGPGLARGYLGRPDLTAQSFLPSPFGPAPGERLYRTGDFCRLRPDGALEFLGRIDSQVKLRGFRIELAEIDAALARQTAVRESLTVVRGEGADRQLVAYVVPHAAARVDPDDLREALRRRLPAYMVPNAFVELPALPLNSNGKVDRAALPAPAPVPAAAAEDALPQAGVEETIARLLAEALGVAAVRRHDNFFDLGAHSLLLARLRGRIEEALGRPVPLVDLFERPTVVALAEHLAGGASPAAEAAPAPLTVSGGPIAIIGMAGRFPKAQDVEELWANLRSGVDCISTFTEAELEAAGVAPELRRDRRFVAARGVLEGGDEFDAAFFDMPPREAELTDPQQRLFLESAWQALESAGYVPESLPGAVGVYAGVGRNTYWAEVLGDDAAVAALGGLQLLLGNDKDFLATRVSYKLGLRGPSLTVQTACSTSLVAVHLAAQALQAGECEVALAGGVSVSFPRVFGYLYEEGGIGSPDGRCRPFDTAARGTVRGEGVGVVVLKPLARALADGDDILAVLLGSAINNDGAAKVGYTAPSVQGQVEVLRAAQARAGVTAESLSYVEAHGTGTPLGDEIELAALTRAFRATTSRRHFCALGALKASLGHLDAASGIAGLIKTVLALRHREIPPSLSCKDPRPELAESPFYIPRELRAWEPGPGPRRAGVSSFGIGGTNVHAILEEPPAPAPAEPGPRGQLLILSARSAAAAERATAALARHLARHPELDPADVAATLQLGRRAFGHRRALVAADLAEAVARLSGPPAGLWQGAPAAVPPVVFLFPGQGTQRLGMGREIYASEPVFRAAVDRSCDLLEPELGFDLRSLLFAAGDAGEEDERRLTATAVAQPALFVVEHALAQLWMSWGIRPAALLGHSLGEIVAACLAGVFSLPDALRWVAARGRLLGALPEGGMLSVRLGAGELVPLLGAELSIAAVNAPDRTVVSGPLPALRRCAERLAARGIEARRLRTSHAFHSPMVDPALAPLGDALRGLTLRAPELPLLSNRTGTWLTAAEATDPDYWVAHVRDTVRFGAGLAALGERPERILLEVGPGRSLAALALAHPGRPAAQTVLHSLSAPGDPESERWTLLAGLGRLWCAGVEVDWRAFQASDRRRRVALPAYPFERRRHTLARPARPMTSRPEAPDPRVRKGPSDWFYAASWQQRPLAATGAAAGPAGAGRLVFLDSDGLGEALVARWRSAGQAPIEVRPGERFRRTGERSYEIAPASEEGYRALFADLSDRGDPLPPQMVHLWSVASPAPPESFEAAQGTGLYSLLSLIRALARRPGGEAMSLAVVTREAQSVTGEEDLALGAATILGALKVIPQELPWLSCRGIDVTLPPAGSRARALLVEQLDAELATVDSSVPAVAYRAGRRWVESYVPLPVGPEAADLPVLRQGGVYLLVGGLGTLGMAIAGRLARAGARLILVGRTPLPPRAAWPDRLAGPDPELARKLRALLALEAAGADLLVLSADAANEEEMRRALAAAEERFGTVHGVVYAAGAPAALVRRPLVETDAAFCQTHFAPKVYGLLVLQRLLAGRPLDFCVVCSSLSSALGGLGFTAYAAANCFADALAQALDRDGSCRWLSVGWDAWAPPEHGREPRGPGAALGESALVAEEGAGAFLRLLALRGVSRVLVSTTDLPARISLWQRPAAAPLPALPPARDLAPPAPRRRQLEATLAEVWRQLLGIETIGPHDNFFQLGGDSLLGVRMVARLHELGLDLHPAQLFEHPTLAGLAAALGPGRSEGDEEGVDAEPAPWQRWRLAGRLESPERWSGGLLLQASAAVDLPRLRRSLSILLAEQGALRQRYTRGPGGWERSASSGGRLPCLVVDHAALPEGVRQAALAVLAAGLRASLDLREGFPFAVGLVPGCGAQGSLLLIAYHPLALDPFSLALLPSLLESCYRQSSPLLPPEAFERWCQQLAQSARAPRLAEEAAGLLSGQAGEVAPWPGLGASAAAEDRESVTVTLDPAATGSLLAAAARLPRGRLEELLAAALLTAWQDWAGGLPLLLELARDARQGAAAPPHAERLLGPFTAVVPLLLTPPADGDPAAALRVVRRSFRALPDTPGLCGASTYPGAERMPEVLLLVTGSPIDRPAPLFERIGEIGGIGSGAGRGHALEVVCEVAERLAVRFDLRLRRDRRETLDRLAGPFEAALRALAARLLAEAPPWEPADFAAAALDDTRLGELLQGELGVDDIYPLSPMQHGMLFHALYDLTSQLYFQQLGYAIEGALDGAAFAAAWRRAVARHDCLRTAFRWEGLPRPLQLVFRHAELPWEELDWRSLPAAEQERRFAAYRKADERRGFDLGRPPLLRCALVRLGDDRYHFLWSHHHLALDGWSGSLLLQEVMDTYRASVLGAVPALRPAPGYGRYIAWLAAQETGGAEEFFRGMWAGLARPTSLLGEEAGRDGRGRREFHDRSCQLSGLAAEALSRWSRRQGLTLGTVFTGVWALLLSRHSGEEKVLFGTTLSGRPPSLPGVESMLGLFINSLPLGVAVDPEEPLLAWLHRLQTQIAVLRSHEHTPLVAIQEWRGGPRDLPLFESLVVCESFAEGAPPQVSAGLRVTPLPALRSTYHYPLYFIVHEAGVPALRLTYDAARLTGAAAEQILAEAVALCARLAAADEGLPLASLLAGAAEEAAVDAGELGNLLAIDEREQFNFRI